MTDFAIGDRVHVVGPSGSQFHIGVDSGDSILKIGVGAVPGVTSMMFFNANGNVSVGEVDLSGTFDLGMRKDSDGAPVIWASSNIGASLGSDCRMQLNSTGGDSFYSATISETGNKIATWGVARGMANDFVISLGATMAVNTALRIDRTTRSLKLNTGFAAWGATPPASQPVKINDPSGGATQDSEARTAINAIIDVLEGAGLSAL